VSTGAFDRTWARLEKPGCPKSDQLASDYGGWDSFKDACLGDGKPPRAPGLPEVPCDADDALWALSVVRAHVAAEQGIDDPDERWWPSATTSTASGCCLLTRRAAATVKSSSCRPASV
jgi:hypothetical protein